jgi:hypothetical protein
MVGAAPITNAGWRLQVTSIILLPGFLWQWLRLPRATRERTKELTNLTILSFSGVALALHFGLWVRLHYHIKLYIFRLTSPFLRCKKIAVSLFKFFPTNQMNHVFFSKVDLICCDCRFGLWIIRHWHTVCCSFQHPQLCWQYWHVSRANPCRGENYLE